jgi:hypothetical protein
MKSNFAQDEFLSWCKTIGDYQCHLESIRVVSAA